MIEINEIVRQYPKELQRPEFYDQMIKEYLHHYMLQSLYNSKHSNKIHFLGGTALRYFYGIQRFSEDLDFDCYNLNREEFIAMTNEVVEGLRYYGFNVECEDKARHLELQAFRRILVFPELKYTLGISPHKEAKFFIKIEAESQHLDYRPDIKILNGFGVTVPVSVVPVGIIFSTKIAAALTRKKDRDFYDIVYLLSFAEPDYNYLNRKFAIDSPQKLATELIRAAESKKLDTRSYYDCEHMLFFKNDTHKLKSFILNIQNNKKLK